MGKEQNMAKFLIVYSSRTGNTKKVAEALYAAAPEGSVLREAGDMPEADGYGAVFAGYWMDRGGPDEAMKAFLRTLSGQKVVLFETMGAGPEGEHAYTGFANAATCLPEGNTVAGVFAVQGAIDPALVAAMRKMGPSNPHGTSQMMQTAEAAASHPDAADLERAGRYMESFAERYRRYFEK